MHRSPKIAKRFTYHRCDSYVMWEESTFPKGEEHLRVVCRLLQSVESLKTLYTTIGRCHSLLPYLAIFFIIPPFQGFLLHYKMSAEDIRLSLKLFFWTLNISPLPPNKVGKARVSNTLLNNDNARRKIWRDQFNSAMHFEQSVEECVDSVFSDLLWSGLVGCQ